MCYRGGGAKRRGRGLHYPPPAGTGSKTGGGGGIWPPDGLISPRLNYRVAMGCHGNRALLPWEPHDKGEWGSGGVGGVGVIRGGVPGMWGVLGVMWKGPRDVGGEGGEPH